MERERYTDRRTGKIDLQADGKRQLDKKTDWGTDIQTGRLINKQTGRGTERQLDKRT